MRIFVVAAGEFTFYSKSEKSKEAKKKMKIVADFLENSGPPMNRFHVLLVYTPTFDATESARELESILKIPDSETIHGLVRDVFDNAIIRWLQWCGNTYPDIIAVANDYKVKEILSQYKYVLEEPVRPGDIYLIEPDQEPRKLFSCP